MKKILNFRLVIKLWICYIIPLKKFLYDCHVIFGFFRNMYL